MAKVWIHSCLVIFLVGLSLISGRLNCAYEELGSTVVVCSGVKNETFLNDTKHFEDLETLRCDNCVLPVITEDTFEKLNKLVHLDLQRSGINAIETSAFKDVNRLETLTLSDNNISKIFPLAFGGMKKLKTLLLQNNKISSLRNDTFLSLTSLNKLILNTNNIFGVEFRAFAGLTSLVELDLSNNKISNISGVFNNLGSLQILNLDKNKLGYLNEDDFSNLKALMRLSISHNNITSLSPGGFPIISSLVALDLSYNSINATAVDLFRSAPALKRLDLSHNKITEIPIKSFQCLFALKYLNVSHNYLTVFKTSVYTSGTPELRFLNLSHNTLDSVDLAGRFRLNSLESLDLSSNNITEFQVEKFMDKFPKVSLLDITNNTLACYVEDGLHTYLAEDSVMLLLSNKGRKDGKCSTKRKESKEKTTTKPTIDNRTINRPKKKIPPVDRKNADSNNASQVVTSITTSTEKAPISHAVVANLINREKYYNSKPAIVWISVFLSILIVTVSLLTYSHCHVRRVVRNRLYSTGSTVRLIPADAEEFTAF